MPPVESEAHSPPPRGCLHWLAMLFALFFVFRYKEPKPTPVTEMAEIDS